MFIQACASLRPIPTLVLCSISISVFLLSTPHLLAQPDAPTNVQVRHIESAEDVSDRSLEVSWDVPAGDVSDYRVWMYRGDRCIEFLQSIDTAETLAAFRGLSPDTTYSFDVRARDDGGWSRFSSCASMTTGATKDVDAVIAEDDQTDGEEESSVPDTPTNVRVRSTSADAVILDWNTPANNGDPITGYAVRYYEGATCSGMSATLVAHTSSHIVFGLDPDATYSFEVRAQNSNGWSDFSNCISTLTVEEEPEEKPDEEPDESGVSEEPSENLSVPIAPKRVWFGAVTSSVVTVMWNSADDATGSQVLLYADDQCVYPMQTDDLQNTHKFMIYRFTGLAPETVYSFNVREKNDAGQSGFSDCVATRTERVPGPGAPTNITVTDTTRGSISLTWDEPDGNEAPIDKYHVGLHHDEQCTVGSSGRVTTEPSVTFTGHNVMPGTTYYANVRALNERGFWGPYSDCIPVTTEPLTAPDAPANVRAQVAMPDEITVVWDAPEDNDRRIMAYEVRRYEDAQCTYPMGEEIVEEPLYVLTGLAPNTAYHIDVRAQNEVGWSDVSECASVTTIPALAPGAPANVQADAAWHEITLTWDEPKDNGSSSVERYRVTVYRGNWGPCDIVLGSRDVSAMSATMTGDYIKPGTDYYLDVRAQNKKGVWSDPSACVSTATKRIAAPDAPTNVAVTDTTEGSISLTWDEPDGNGSPVEKYRANVYHDEQCTVSNGFHETASPSVTIDGFTIMPGTTYHVAVRARNEQGRWSDYSDCIPATTEPLTAPDEPEKEEPVTYPNAPTNLTATDDVSHNSITISWDDDNDDILRWWLLVYEGEACLQPLKWGLTDVRSYTVTGLDPDTTYSFRVGAENNGNLESNLSECFVSSTEKEEGASDDDAPVDDEEPAEGSAPTNLRATGVTDNSVTLSWDDDSDDVLRWWLLVYEDEACSRSLNMWESTDRSHTATGLDPDTEYFFSVAAQNHDDLLSDYSACLSVTTEKEEGASDDDAPVDDEEPVEGGAPTNLAATDDVSHNSITLSWDDDNDDILRWWLLVYEDAACSQPLNVWESTNRSYTVTGLNPDTTYSFRVAAENSGNLVSDLSECFVSSTEKEEGVSDDDAPEEPIDEEPVESSAPTNLRATGVTNNSVALAWDDVSDDVDTWWLLVYEDEACSQPLGAWKSTNRSYTVTGLNPDTTYSFHVAAENSGSPVSDRSECLASSTEKEEEVSDDDAPEEPIDEEPVTHPNAPTNLTATDDVSHDSITLSWDDDNDNILRWWLLAYEDATCSQSLNVWESADRSYTVTGLNPDTAYSFRVVAENSGNLVSDLSECFVSSTEKEEGASDDDAPEEPIDEEPVEGSAPTDLRATGVTDDSVALAWDMDDGTPSWVIVYRDDQCTDALVVRETEGTAYTVTDLASATVYSFAIRARNGDVRNNSSDCLSVMTDESAEVVEEPIVEEPIVEEPIEEEPVTHPNAPTNLTATDDVSHDSITLSWDDDNNDVSRWWLLVYEDEACSRSLNVWESTDRSYTATGLDPDTEYFFNVAAQNHDGLLSDYSACLSATTEKEEGVSDDDAPEEPIDEEPVEGGAPTNLRATGVTDDSVALAWDDDNDDTLRWWLLVYEDEACSRSLNVWESADRSYTATGLDPDTEYFFNVAAQNHDGLLSDYSACLSATTGGE